ncbi:MAG: hypothetical protein QE271_14830 [Bacteriovoracaceae bacterium]|nr:hypothetical protein [Bacteriovoracaceae bacterium]
MDKNKLIQKPKLLFAWGNPYIFTNTILPMLTELAENFSLYVIIPNYFMPPVLEKSLEELKTNGVIQSFWIAPNFCNIFKHHQYLNSHLKTWKNLDFDILVSATEIEIMFRYLSKLALRPSAKRIIFMAQLGYLLENEKLAKALLQIPVEKADVEPTQVFKRNLKTRFQERNSLGSFFFWFLKTAINRTVLLPIQRASKKWEFFANYSLLPVVYSGINLKRSKNDTITQIGSGSADLYVFCDQLEAAAHLALWKQGKAVVINQPSSHSCRCDQGKNKKSLLVPLAGFFGLNKLPDSTLDALLRDITTSANELETKEIHLRPHPREYGKWAEHLKTNLEINGFFVKLIGSEIPLRDIACDYIGVASCATSALRDIRVACSHTVIIGFSHMSRSLNVPPLILGESLGIGWILEDGSYDPNIFKQKKFVPPKRRSFPQVLLKL